MSGGKHKDRCPRKGWTGFIEERDGLFGTSIRRASAKEAPVCTCGLLERREAKRIRKVDEAKAQELASLVERVTVLETNVEQIKTEFVSHKTCQDAAAYFRNAARSASSSENRRIYEAQAEIFAAFGTTPIPEAILDKYDFSMNRFI